MNNKVSKGIALLLFGILLCAGSEEINAMILSGFGDFPFSAIGVIVGAAYMPPAPGLLCLIREHHRQPHGPHKDAYRGKRKIAEAEQNRDVDFLTACAKQNAKEKQCDAF